MRASGASALTVKARVARLGRRLGDGVLLASLNASLVVVLAAGTLLGCANRPIPGPDRQGAGVLQGAASGALTGASIGVQAGAAAGPAGALGAGLGAIAGAIQGASLDAVEDRQIKLSRMLQAEEDRSRIQQILTKHFGDRARLHPGRDLFAADIFFKGDESRLSDTGQHLIDEIAKLNKERMPWSRLVVASYVKGEVPDKKSDEPEGGRQSRDSWALKLAERRAEQIVNRLIKGGLEPRRLLARGVIVDAPVLIEPESLPGRYNQALEFIMVDR